MGILSSSVSITRYKVEGKLKAPVTETLEQALKKYAIADIDGQAADKTIGWTSIDNPYQPNFNGASFVFGTIFGFTLRIDRKTIPSKIVQKHYAVEMNRILKKTGRKYLARDEKKILKSRVIDTLGLRIPATPHLYDVIWHYDESIVWFFSNLKAANEELESLFLKSFKCVLVRMFPYTLADLELGLSESDRDQLTKIAPTNFIP
jgi:DNA recombination-dependent growth factor C